MTSSNTYLFHYCCQSRNWKRFCNRLVTDFRIRFPLYFSRSYKIDVANESVAESRLLEGHSKIESPEMTRWQLIMWDKLFFTPWVYIIISLIMMKYSVINVALHNFRLSIYSSTVQHPLQSIYPDVSVQKRCYEMSSPFPKTKQNTVS